MYEVDNIAFLYAIILVAFSSCFDTLIVHTNFFFSLIFRAFVREDQSSREYFRVAVHQVLIMEGKKLSGSRTGHVVTVNGDLSLANLDVIFSIQVLIKFFFDVQTASQLT